jgi:hypothetical protein
MSPAPANRLPAELEPIRAWRKTAGITSHRLPFRLYLDAEHLLPAVRLLFDHGYFSRTSLASTWTRDHAGLPFDRYDAAQRWSA